MKDHRPWLQPRRFLSLALLAIAIAGFPRAPDAAQLTISDLALTTEAGLGAPRNVFHRGDSGGVGSSYSPLGFFGLNKTEINYYNPDTGEFEIHLNIFEDIERTQMIGQAWGSSSTLEENLFTEQYGSSAPNFWAGEVVAKIAWGFQLDAGNGFYDYLVGLGSTAGDWSATTRFIDNLYFDSPVSGNRINTDENGGVMYLTGADGDQMLRPGWPLPWSRTGFFNGSSIGVDLSVNLAPVPEPGTIVLLGTGLMGLVGYTRRRSRA